jgi:plastocyanin
MRKILLLAVTATLAFNAQPGEIVGTIRAEGKPEAADSAKGGRYDSRKYKFVERVNYAELEDFLVFIDQKVTNAPATPPRTLQVITQRDAVFRPHVLPVVAGSTVEWPNHDDIYHNVFSMSESNPFDLGLYKDPVVKSTKFENAGRVDVFCSIHSKMNCVILVLQNPFYSAADKNGKYRIENVPAGTYRLKAWHERMPPQIREVVVPERGEVKVDFVLGIKGLPQL